MGGSRSAEAGQYLGDPTASPGWPEVFMKYSKRILLVALLGVSACTSPGPEPASERVSPDILRATPRDCPLPLVRAGSIGGPELPEGMRGHLPLWLPDGFGLARAFGPGDGALAGAIWTDHQCREIALYLWDSHEGHAGEGPGHRVGDWILLVNEPRDCGNAVLGQARCLGYRASVESGTLGIQMMGVHPSIGDRIVRSIPT